MTPRHKPQPCYTQFNQPPRSPKDGKNRRPPAPTHRGAVDGTDPSAPGTDKTVALTNSQWTTQTFAYIAPESPPSPTIPYAGVRAGEIIGHRAWLVYDDHYLGSLAHDFIWEPGQVIEGKVDEIAYSDPFMTFKPIMGGVYCFVDMAPLLLEEMTYVIYKFPLIAFSNRLVHGLALGTIKCWGEVIEHEYGYRAQFARVHSIDSTIGPVDIEAIRKRYLP